MNDLDIERACIADIALRKRCEYAEAQRAWRDMLPARKEAKRECVRLLDRWLDRVLNRATGATPAGSQST